MNNLGGTLPTEIGKLPLLNWFQLSQTQLSGGIPSEIARTKLGFMYVPPRSPGGSTRAKAAHGRAAPVARLLDLPRSCRQ